MRSRRANRNAHGRTRAPGQLAAVLLLTAISIAARAAEVEGAELYMQNCSNCHGVYGEGDGSVSPDLAVAMLDLRYLSARNDGVFPTKFVREIIDGRETRAAHGPVGMPVWGAEFARDEGPDAAAEERVQDKINALVDYLKAIQLKQ